MALYNIRLNNSEKICNSNLEYVYYMYTVYSIACTVYTIYNA